MRDFTRTRFDRDDGAGAIGDLPNLADLMLVFATGLIAALAASPNGRTPVQEADLGRELPDLPTGAEAGGAGLEAVGRVFRDPETGKLYVVK
ncbi:hypothetical protein [Eilatimonas milleporae]|uniref:Uncharacterized protein n=1 Tax=Eilatimonas milleporae TaxID=911205 RepID=A0A3M0BVV0_9PROT|nr:hypothetical protein [Eilatimonas milleporae]RMB00685.1 hypothetical protein BXY39_3873 [Eilatimonas milleporae]